MGKGEGVGGGGGFFSGRPEIEGSQALRVDPPGLLPDLFSFPLPLTLARPGGRAGSRTGAPRGRYGDEARRGEREVPTPWPVLVVVRGVLPMFHLKRFLSTKELKGAEKVEGLREGRGRGAPAPEAFRR